MEYNSLSKEQQNFVDKALQGYNILVDACIGSGKTTAIQVLCNMLPSTRRVLYLTYNKLLKLDAKDKIRNYNVHVQNYHGFAYGELVSRGYHCGISDVLQSYKTHGIRSIGYDILILDEYQDIDQEISDMLVLIKQANPGLQIIAVGDMAQKIYDKTSLNVMGFMNGFLGSCYKLEFTQCFRLCAPLAGMLGQVWGKSIVGVNNDCEVSYMSLREVFNYVSTCEPKDILCLGSNNGRRSWLLNELEYKFPDKFNKRTVWSKITDNDSGAAQPDSNVGIFTTFDGCKGMERDVCVVFDWTLDYWQVRLGKPYARYEILRNIFCVAASRGKKKVIFCVNRDRDILLNAKTLMKNPGRSLNIDDMEMSKMFDFKFVEDIEDAYRSLSVKEVQGIQSEIKVPSNDYLIDLSPCIGIYQECAYFKNSNIDDYINFYFVSHPDNDGLKIDGWESWPLESKVLYLVSLETGQNRYLYQVDSFITEDAWTQIRNRLCERLDPSDISQVKCDLKFYDKTRYVFSAVGFCDVVKDDVVYELKFTAELSHVHALQLAMYLVSMDKPMGLLWNVRTNQVLEIQVPDKKVFLDKAVRAATKGHIKEYSDGKLSDLTQVQRPANTRAFAYQDKTIQFVREHSHDCYAVMLDYMADTLLGHKCSPRKAEQYFAENRISMPMSGKTFLKYFGDGLLSNISLFTEDEQSEIRKFLDVFYGA